MPEKSFTKVFQSSQNFFEAPQKSVKTNFVIFISIILGCSGQEGLKVFSPGIFISKKMVTNMKLAFTNMHF